MISSLRALNGLWFARRYHLAPLLLIFVFGIAISWPLWWLGFPPQTDDAMNHLSWFVRFAPQFWSGELYPRWLPNANAGLGSPAFFYYPPLAAWAASLLGVIWHTDDLWIVVGRSASFALIASGFTMYAWLQTLVPRRWAALSAVIFLIGPYRTTVDLWLRGALAEHWGFVWLPLLLWMAQNLASNPPVQSKVRCLRAWCAMSILFALLLLTHPPTAVIFSPVVFAYVFFCSANSALETSSRKEMLLASTMQFFLAVLALVCGAILAAFYLLPAIQLEPLVWMEEMRAGPFSYLHSFITLANLRDGLRLHGVAATTMLIIIFVCWAVLRVSRDTNSAHNLHNDSRHNAANLPFRRASFWLVIAVLATFMTTSWSALLYANLMPIQRIQAPWRWLVVVSMALAPMMAEALNSWSQRKPRCLPFERSNEYSKWLKGAILFSCGLVVLWVPLQVFYLCRSYPQLALTEKMRRQNVSWIHYVKTFVDQGGEAFGHRPRHAKTLKNHKQEIFRKFGHGVTNYIFADIVLGQQDQPKSERVTVHLVERAPRHIVLILSPKTVSPKTASLTTRNGYASNSKAKAQNVVIRLKQFYFEGWIARSSSKKLEVFPSVPDGLTLINVPVNARRVTITLEPFPIEILSARISLIAFILIVLLLASTLLCAQKNEQLRCNLMSR